MPDFSNLAAAAITILSPYFVAGAEQYAKEVGKDLYTKTKQLKEWLWKKIKKSQNPSLSQTKELFESQPGIYAEAMEKMLLIFLESHPEIAEDLAKNLSQFEVSDSNSYSINIHGGKVYGIAQGNNAKFEQKLITKESKKF